MSGAVNGTGKTNGVHSASTNGHQHPEDLKIAIIGQSNFAAEVLEVLLEREHMVVGVFTIADKGSREDVLATTARQHRIPVFKFPAWRRKGVPIPEVLEQYRSVGANLNVLPFCSQFIPMEVIDGASFGSICYHPSLLPLHRGASAISWTLINGDERAGFSIFWADDGLDTGPVLLQKQCPVYGDDTLDSLYKRFLYPEGVTSMAEAVDMIAAGTAPKIPQTEIGASYDPALFREENQYVNLNQSAVAVFNFIRGLDSVPGALAIVETESGTEVPVRLFGASLCARRSFANAKQIQFKGTTEPAYVCKEGIFITGTDGRLVKVKRLKRGNKVIQASQWFEQANAKPAAPLELTEKELESDAILRGIWKAILKVEIEPETDFFACGAGSMDVVRLVEEVKDTLEVPISNETLFMAPTYGEFMQEVVLRLRSGNDSVGVGANIGYDFRHVVLKANRREIVVPTQMFVGGRFVDAEGGKTLPIVNPTTEQPICEVAAASKGDVDEAVKSADEAFKTVWTNVSARERGQMMFRLAELMEQHKEELATIESIDSGAVYTLALKTHVGMSIDAWRYYAGWADKIEGTTIPVSPARPNHVLTFTKREPIGVCALITPWNYPLMMLSWKMAACIAAGNTVVIKPAQVCPMTALKFAELTVRAGFPPGVINVVTGTGSLAGQALADHPLVRKLGFTGSTPIGKRIMASCAESNIKKCSMELGGKSPLVIFADCDLEKAVRLGMSAVFFNKGENCIAAGRLFVEDRVHDEFVRKVVKGIRTMKIGDPLDRATAHGPQNHLAHLQKLQEYCTVGVKEGATLVCGGKRVPHLKGLFFEPTVFTDVEDHMYIAQEESFGPIMVISKFHSSDFEALVARANNTEYGLASGVFTKDIQKALLFAEKVEAGTVFINTYNKTDVAAPFGGFKQSGFGKDLGKEALNEYLKTKCVTVEY
ncbi:cytosolic 10-formyltetrahydrofolate dehydrogenase [Anopheles ziemanni]|uniref:cytosolic 10-formyltetrahydrofolate dehydrogenase n=1 Tax=Anopheles coustani TaxID=139045 RepID=UPI00265A7BAE|nr:cytosolic 10-formyltetrahydrofolate dehydrogenase [Anopheles coustani]XP_058177309.1 cytosolic 10-formyltetrahydrofolate dehydrogenase [Anopheles ziemanni]